MLLRPEEHVRPTAMAGIKALLRYAVEGNVDGQGWPPELPADDGRIKQPWQSLLVENVASAVST